MLQVLKTLGTVRQGKELKMSDIKTAESQSLSPSQIKDLRYKLGENGIPISQAELGKLLGGVTYCEVGRWERGQHTPHKLAMRELVKLWDSLNNSAIIV